MKFSKGFLRYARNTGFLLFEKIIRSIVNVVVWAMVVRYLGPEQFGILSYVLSFVFLFNILSDLGLDSIIVRELIKDKALENKILGTTFFIKLAGAFLAAFLILGIVSFRHSDTMMIQMMFLLSLRMIFQSLNGIDYYFQSHVLSKYTVYSQLLGLVSTTALCLIFICLKKSLIYFSAVILIESIVIGLGLIFFYQHTRQNMMRWKVDRVILKKLFADSWPLILSGIAVSIYMRIDQIMIKDMIGRAAVGYYSAAVRVSEVFYFVPILLTSSLFPAIVNARLNDSVLYQNRLKALFSLLMYLGVGISMVIGILAPWIIKTLYGDQFLPSVSVLSIHIWANVFVFLGVARTRWMINENLQIFSAPYLLLAAAVNILLNLYLIPRYGINGAAVATVAAQCIAAVFSNLLNFKTRKIFSIQLQSLNCFNIIRNRLT